MSTVDQTRCSNCGCSDRSSFIEDVVTGDTICAACGYVVDRMAQLYVQLPYVYSPLLSSDESSDDRSKASISSSSRTVDRSDADTTTSELYGRVFKRLSQLTPDIDRRSRVVLQHACEKAVRHLPCLGFKKPANIALAVYALFYKPAGRPRGPTALKTDEEFMQMCNLLNTKVSSVVPVIRLIEKNSTYGRTES